MTVSIDEVWCDEVRRNVMLIYVVLRKVGFRHVVLREVALNNVGFRHVQ